MQYWVTLSARIVLEHAQLAAFGQPVSTPPPPTPTPVPPLPPDIQSKVDWLVGLYQTRGLAAVALGIFVLALISVISFFAIKFLEDWVQARFTPKPPPGSEAVREGETEYVWRINQSDRLGATGDSAAQLMAYLSNLEARASIPDGDDYYVPLEGGLAPDLDLAPRLGLAPQPKGGQSDEVFKERQTFKDLAEAMIAIDPDTGQPYPSFALLGEPGAGKSTLLRKFVRDAVH